jgi:hypothetical protein
LEILEKVIGGRQHRLRNSPSGKHSDLATLLKDRLCRSVRLYREFGLLNLKIQPFQALAARDELGFA